VTIALLWFAISDQLPVSLSTTCTPPPMEVERVEPRWRLMGRLKEGGVAERREAMVDAEEWGCCGEAERFVPVGGVGK